jgi:hypothetical protein
MFVSMTKPHVRKIKDGYMLVAPCEVRVRLGWTDPVQQFTIPAGFVFNGANFGWLVFWRKSVDTTAALVHDYLYMRQGVAHMDGQPACPLRFTRKECDKLFRQITERVDNVQSWRAFLAYMALRAFGWWWWDKR